MKKATTYISFWKHFCYSYHDSYLKVTRIVRRTYFVQVFFKFLKKLFITLFILSRGTKNPRGRKVLITAIFMLGTKNPRGRKIQGGRKIRGTKTPDTDEAGMVLHCRPNWPNSQSPAASDLHQGHQRMGPWTPATRQWGRNGTAVPSQLTQR
jgi:hypothetical protein